MTVSASTPLRRQPEVRSARGRVHAGSDLVPRMALVARWTMSAERVACMQVSSEGTQEFAAESVEDMAET
jgi:hypothetical protein